LPQHEEDSIEAKLPPWRVAAHLGGFFSADPPDYLSDPRLAG
jgi:hypothetical protein